MKKKGKKFTIELVNISIKKLKMFTTKNKTAEAFATINSFIQTIHEVRSYKRFPRVYR